MPNKKSDHETCRQMVCAVCWCESGQKASRGVSVTMEAAIKSHLVSSYSRTDPRFPSGLCSGCTAILFEWIKGLENPRPLPVAEKYDAVIPIMTRSSPQCTCSICKLARMNGLEWKRFSVSKKEHDKPPPISKNSGDRLCPTCFSRIYRGSKHSTEACKSSKVAVENLAGVSPSIIEKIVHHHLSAITESGDKTIKINSVVGGKAMLVTVGQVPDHAEIQPLTAEEILIMQTEASLSDNQMLSVLKNLRLKWGWKHIEPYVKNALAERKGVFKDFFKVETVTFKDSNDKPFDSPLVYCCDLVGFVETLSQLRGYNFTDMAEKIGMDSGKGHLRMVLTMYDDEDLLHVSTGDIDRVTRKQGIGAGSR